MKSPHPPSPPRETLRLVVTVRRDGDVCSVRGAALCRWGVEPRAPARSVTQTTLSGRVLAHAGSLFGYRLMPM
jgi:hypothetical protein